MRRSNVLLLLSCILTTAALGQPALPDYLGGPEMWEDSTVIQPIVQVPLRPNPFAEFSERLRNLAEDPAEAKAEALFLKEATARINIKADIDRLKSLMHGIDPHALSLMFKDLDAYPPEAKAREFWAKRIRALTPHDATALCIITVDGRERGWLPLSKSDEGLLIVPSGR